MSEPGFSLSLGKPIRSIIQCGTELEAGVLAIDQHYLYNNRYVYIIMAESPKTYQFETSFLTPPSQVKSPNKAHTYSDNIVTIRDYSLSSSMRR